MSIKIKMRKKANKLILSKGIEMIYLNKNVQKGFSFLEMIIVVAILGVLLAIFIPNFINYYWQQRFNQEVQHLIASFRRAQITSVSTNHWIGLAMHPDCKTAEGPSGSDVGRFCMQVIRLPLGSCNIMVWPPAWENLPDCNEADALTLCEFKEERFPMEKLIQLDSMSQMTLYIVGPDGTVTVQSSAPASTPICSDLPIPIPALQMIFRLENQGLYKGICISGRGNVYSTEILQDKNSLSCPI